MDRTVTPDEYVSWLTDLRDAQQAIEKAGTVAGINKAKQEKVGRRQRRPAVLPLSDNSFRVYGVANRAAISAEMERATADDIEKRLRA